MSEADWGPQAQSILRASGKGVNLLKKGGAEDLYAGEESEQLGRGVWGCVVKN